LNKDRGREKLTICKDTEDDYGEETLNSPDREHEGSESQPHDEEVWFVKLESISLFGFDVERGVWLDRGSCRKEK
jgi:hypothetical protein